MSPRKQERIFAPQYAGELLLIAEGDLFSAIAISEHKEARLENAFYMVQQSIEKAIKAVLVKKGLPVPMVHDLGVLIAKLPSDLTPPFGYELSDLNQYAAIRRYEIGQFKLDHEEFTLVLEKCREILAWCVSQ